MHIRHRQFLRPAQPARHMMLFELIRQDSKAKHSQDKAHAVQHAAMEDFRAMACASLTR